MNAIIIIIGIALIALGCYGCLRDALIKEDINTLKNDVSYLQSEKAYYQSKHLPRTGRES